MGRKAIFQTVGAIVLGFNVAIPMVLDAQGLFPDLPYQYYTLIGFLAFAIYMSFIIFSKQSHINKLESGRPVMTLGNRARAKTVNNEAAYIMDTTFRLLFRNAGAKNAYRLIFRAAFASAQDPTSFTALPDEASANLIAPNTNLEFGRDVTVKQPYEWKDNKRTFPQPAEWLIYSAVIYSDKPIGGKQYKDEWWFFYRLLGKDLQDASLEQKGELEPHVKAAFGVS